MNGKLVNFISFQVIWFLCVLGAAGGWEGLAAAISGFLLVRHVALSASPGRELLLLASVGLFGLVVDSMQQLSGQLAFAGTPLLGSLCPLWIVLLWINLGTTLDGCLAWLAPHFWLSALLGGVSGALAYRGAASLGALELGSPLLPLLITGAVYSVALPLLFRVQRVLTGNSTATPAPAPTTGARG